MGRYIAADDPEGAKGTSDEEAALKDEEGNPIANPARQSWVSAVAITTALNTSYNRRSRAARPCQQQRDSHDQTGIGLVILAFAVFGREPATETRSARSSTQPATG